MKALGVQISGFEMIQGLIFMTLGRWWSSLKVVKTAKERFDEFILGH